jgi:DNA-directed RNA polymerase subunit RPC12/RpoP
LLTGCNESVINSTSEIEKKNVCTEHIRDDGIVVTEPGCGGYGIIKYYCTKCGKMFFDTISPYPHSYEFIKIVEPTCTEGVHHLYICTACGSEDKSNFKSALGHSFSGEKCVRCGVENPAYQKNKEGETLVIDGYLELTINKVYPCEGYVDGKNKHSNGVAINYTYKNLSTETLEVSSVNLELANSNMELGDYVYCWARTQKAPKRIAPGMKYTAEMCFTLPSITDTVYAVFKDRKSVDYPYNYHYFELKVEKPESSANQDTEISSSEQSDDSSSTLWTFSDAVDVNSYAEKAHSAMLSANSYVSSAMSSSTPEMKVACYLDAISSVKTAKKHLNSIKKIASDLKELELTGSDYDTFQDYVNTVYKACDDITDISLTVDNYKSYESDLRNDISDIMIDCLGIQGLSVKLMDAFG